jgi:hypothetical protein
MDCSEVSCAHIGGKLSWYVEGDGEHDVQLAWTVSGVSCTGKGD